LASSVTAVDNGAKIMALDYQFDSPDITACKNN